MAGSASGGPGHPDGSDHAGVSGSANAGALTAAAAPKPGSDPPATGGPGHPDGSDQAGASGSANAGALMTGAGLKSCLA